MNKKEFYCEILVKVTNSKLEKKLNIKANLIKELEVKIIENVSKFSLDNSVHIPCKYNSFIADSINEEYKHIICIEFKKSNCFSKDEFYSFWEEEMERLGKLK